MYVWRLPLFSYAVLVTTALVYGAVAAALWLRGRTPVLVMRGLFASAVVVAMFAAPFLMHMLTRGPLAAAAQRGLFIDPAPFLGFVPAVAAIVLVALSRLAFPAGDHPKVTLMYRAYFVSLLFVLAVLNLANWCTPGWCERFGFPFPYSWWSDAIVVMNGENLSAGVSSIALALNVAVAAAASYSLFLSYRRATKLQ
jgi:hypothetical protein